MSFQIIYGTSDKNTVVFLHGYLLSNEQWHKLALHRAPWRSVLVELPYHGQSRSPLDAPGLEPYAKFVLSALEHVGVHKYSLVGHSMGGYIGLLMLEKDPKLEKLLLLHSNIWEDSPERKTNRERVAEVVKRSKNLFLRESLPLLFKDKVKHQKQIEKLVVMAQGMSNEGIVHGALAMRNRTAKFDSIAKNKDRSFFIQGSHDALIPNVEARKVWNEFGNPDHFYVIPDCGHMSHLERPRVLQKILQSILSL